MRICGWAAAKSNNQRISTRRASCRMLDNSSLVPIMANILLVDDRAANLLALESILSDLGKTVVRTSSGEEALARLAEGDFAVILLDVQMPGLSGFETAKRIRSL